MTALWTALLFVGGGLVLVASVWMLVAAFRTSFLWGLGVLLLPPVSLAFLFAHWREARRPFFVNLVGLTLGLFGVFLGGSLGTPGQGAPEAVVAEAEAGAAAGAEEADAPAPEAAPTEAAPTEAGPAAAEVPESMRDFTWYVFSAGGRAHLRQEARAEGVCELSCTLDDAPTPTWRKEGCVGQKADFRFVSDTCEHVLVLFERPSMGPSWATTEVGVVYASSGEARPIQAGRLVQDDSKLRESGAGFFWLGGTAGIPGARPRGLREGTGGVELVTADRRTHQLRFDELPAAEWAQPLGTAELRLLGGGAGWYRYQDADGSMHFAESLSEVPREYRARAVPVSGSVSSLGGNAPSRPRASSGSDDVMEALERIRTKGALRQWPPPGQRFVQPQLPDRR